MAAAVAAIVWLRLALDGVQPYGADGAEYIEHAARLAVLRTVQDLGLFPPWTLLVASDGAFPPLMHLSMLVPGALFGHEAGVAAATGVGWLLLLAFAVGWTVAGLTGRSSLAAPAAAATLLMPAAHGMATRYYYDLPMIALLWLAVAILLAGREERPLLAGGAAGVALAGAALVKWAALAFGPPMLLGALLVGWRSRDGRRRRPGRRAVAGVACVAVAGALCLAFVAGRGTDNSLAMMGRVAFTQVDPAEWDVREDAPGPIASASGQLVDRLSRLRAEDLVFYPLRLVTSVLSPALALLLLPLLFVWGRAGREGLALLVAIALGHGLFLLGVMPVLDDRFASIGAPALVVAGVCGWARLERQPRAVLAALVLAVGLAVGLDFHFGPPAPWNAEIEVLAPDRDDFPPTALRGVGLASSVERRGWSRGDASPASREALRDAVWEAVLDCGGEGVAVAYERPLVSPDGDAEWLRYRSLLSELADGVQAPAAGGVCPGDGRQWDLEGRLDLVLTAAGAELPGCLRPHRWRRAREVADPDAGPGVVIWARREGAGC